MSSEFAVQVAGLGKCFHIYDRPQDRLWQMLSARKKQRYRELWAVKDVSLTIEKGETIGIIGRNGSGKSTLLQLICGTLGASSGTVTCNGRIAALLELGSGFNPDFTGRENVFLNGAILGLSRAEIAKRFDDIADFAGIGDFIDQPTRTYSSGMLMRLAFAVSVWVEPDILIVDEALAVGDASFQFKCLQRLEALTQRGTTLLFVSHDMSMVKRFCKRALYLRNGLVRANGPPEDVAELYLLDMRDEQRRWASGDTVIVSPKEHLANTGGIAFGTNEGRILSACFINTEGLHSTFIHDEMIEVRIEALIHESITLPSISLTIQEARLLVIGGANLALEPQASREGWRKASITARFPSRFAAGRYYITLKLMNGHTEETAHLIEKQVALLTFDTLVANNAFLGLVDLGIEPLPPMAANSNASTPEPEAERR
ncbi:ABC transporter ATP-binding protein [Pseudomonas gingeri]|uniref:ABC transporter ATP-binding protein n=1 Tax=Pseudomonas gingeri TaxID=117681 RepID=A0A7Y7YGT8_9PSED|nr:ABC transporter ATP-binding protein [Pseudomonas gingeri]NWA02616.1 ABC transporter ATP-binding protein [Pseudomonas gingeri]NWA12211.1 ABC transporter ATP-binding protein [Pseudomonas gingeri]NWA57383.1 ABC transporter ATP-binding protein [Pseudomonas gingeri]NWA93726.1 ABC transporter ATP-binding protein [Pseudomonas gingeri]NWB03198.1 ABC transporter ATP-binding protein [Pseudomonas gingeri]